MDALGDDLLRYVAPLACEDCEAVIDLPLICSFSTSRSVRQTTRQVSCLMLTNGRAEVVGTFA